MPGIVGLITKMPRELAEPQLMRMLETLHHEPFYTRGVWIDESSGVYLGGVARKGSFSETIPMRNEEGNIVLAFSGEEFPEAQTAERLKRRGHQFDLDGASYLVHLYEENPSFVSGLNGRFHGLLSDQGRGTAILFNDRYGMHKVYYHEARDTFYFAAEAKAILSVRPECRRLDPQGVGEFISCGSVLENRTLFEGIYALPPASAWVFRNSALEQKGSYFHPKEWEEQEELSPREYYGELRKSFRDNLSRYFTGQQLIGMSLTGGLDTRMIMAWREKSKSLPCYTFGGMFRDCQDVIVARQVARACGQPHQVIQVGAAFLTRFPYYAERAVYLTEGCVDVGRVPDLYLNERAREIAPVRMTGNYGGEILRGVRAFKPVRSLPGLFQREFLTYIRHAEETYAGLLGGHPVSFAAFKQGPWHHAGVLALEETQVSMRSPYLDNDFVRTVFRSPRAAMTSAEIALRLIADGNTSLLQIPTDRGLGGNKGRFHELASQGLHEFLFKAEYAYDLGMPQWAARLDNSLSSLHLDRLFLGRHKIFHFRVWYRDALAKYVREMLLDPRSLSRPYIDGRRLEAIAQSHLSGDQNYTTEIHKLLTLELVHRLFLDGEPDLKTDHGRSNQLEASLR
jgi:asparagine synthase (glutamine-hydrolysing)